MYKNEFWYSNIPYLEEDIERLKLQKKKLQIIQNPYINYKISQNF